MKNGDIKKLKTNKEIYEFASQQKPKDLVNLIYSLPSEKVQLACKLAFSFCDRCARSEQEKPLLEFITLMGYKMKIEKKFRKEINGVLNFMAMSDDEKQKMVSNEERKKIRQIQQENDKDNN
jgi:hypothetical protein